MKRKVLQVVGVLALAACASMTAARSGPPPTSADQVRPLLIGAEAPELTLRQVDGKPFDLTEAIRSKPSVVILYRGGW